MAYSLTDYSATEIEFNDGINNYYYKKCYCSVELQAETIVFTSHRVENNNYRQSWSVAYTDFTTPTGSASTVYNAIKTIIENYAGGGTGGGGIDHGTASGTDTYTVTISGVTDYNDGDAYLIRFTNGNTTSATLNINGLGARTLYRNNDGALIGGDIVNGGEALCVYNSTTNGFQCIGTAPNTLLAYVTNADSVTINKGQPVYAFGGTGDRLTVKRAYNTTDATSAQTIGVVQSTSIGVNQKGLIIMQGQLDNLNIFPTSTWADGDPIYLGATAGTLTNVKPFAPNHLVYVGYVLTASNGSAGRMYVRPQNGYELKEIHDVQAQSPALNDTLWYDTSVNQWKTASLATILGYTPVASTRNISTTAPLTGGGDLSANRTLAITQAATGTDGYLSSTDWNTFNGRMQSIWQYRKTGRWWTAAFFPVGALGTITNFANSIRYIPFLVDRDITVTQLGINVATIAGVGTTCRLGIYSNNASTTAPNARLVDTGTLVLDTLGVKPSATLSVSLTKGLYWLAYVSNATTGTITSIPATSIIDVKGTSAIAGLGVCAAVQSFTYAALPATASGLTDAAGLTQPSIYYFW